MNMWYHKGPSNKKTREQLEVDHAIDTMKKADGYVIRSHMNIKGKRMYRLVDPNFAPVMNLDFAAVQEAVNDTRLSRIEGQNGTFILNKNYEDGTLRLSRNFSSEGNNDSE